MDADGLFSVLLQGGIRITYGRKPFSIIRGPKVRATWSGPAFTKWVGEISLEAVLCNCDADEPSSFLNSKARSFALNEGIPRSILVF